jgi:cell division protein FtsA
MGKNDLFTGVDVGAQVVRVVIGQLKANEEVDVLGVGEAPLARDSFQANQETLVAAIKRAVDDARKMASAPARNVSVGVPGTFLKGTNSKGVVRVRNRQIDEDDVRRVLDTASAIPLGEGATVLRLLPQDYMVDHHPNVKDPRGIHGVRLDARLHVVIANQAQVQNLRDAAARSGLDVAELVPTCVAASEAVLHDGEKELGVVLLDLGTNQTEVAVWVNGAIHYTGVVPFGGSLLTRDISKGLRLPQLQAEEIKRRYGIAISQMVDEDEIIEIPNMTDDTTVRRSRRILAEFIEPRLEDLFTYIRDMLRDSGLEAEIRGGVVLTGGSSELKGIEELGKEVLGLPVRIGKPDARNHIGGMVEYIRNCSLSTAVGLVLYGARGIRGGLYVPAERSGGSWKRILERLAASF